MEVFIKILTLLVGGIIYSFLLAVFYTIARTPADELWEITRGLFVMAWEKVSLLWKK